MKISDRVSPYVFGALSGLLLTASAALTGNFLGLPQLFRVYLQAL